MTECTPLIKDRLFKVSYGKGSTRGGLVNSILKVTLPKEIFHIPDLKTKGGLMNTATVPRSSYVGGSTSNEAGQIVKRGWMCQLYFYSFHCGVTMKTEIILVPCYNCYYYYYYY